MTVNHWTQTAADLCRAIASPDLDDVPIAILDADVDPAAAELLPDNVCGFTSGLLPLALGSPHSHARQFSCVVSPSRLWRWPQYKPRPDILRSLAICCTLHELAHHCQTLALARHVATTCGCSTVLRSAITQDALVQCLSAASPEPAEPWFAHGESFIRASLHVSRRARQYGFQDANIRNMHIADYRYGLSPPDDYARALGDEPERRSSEPISVILCDEPPQPFLDLFEMDKKAHAARTAEANHQPTCTACMAFREELGRVNSVVVTARRHGREYLRCRNCGNEWTADTANQQERNAWIPSI